MARLIMTGEQTLGFAETPHFERFVQTSLQPQYQRIPRNTVKARCFARFRVLKDQLLSTFNSLDNISLTSDIWTDRIEQAWICVTAHWIDADWIMQKRIIAFRKFPPPHSRGPLFTMLSSILDEFGITNKVFSMSFDNASNNTAVITDLIRRCGPPLNGELFHIRCCCHILNLVVQDALRAVGSSIEKIKDAILCIKGNHQRKRLYRELCIQMGKTPALVKDNNTRWNSTYNMLNIALNTADMIAHVWNDYVTDDYHITPYDWEVARNMTKFLKVFLRATERFSACYTPTSHIVLEELYCIAHLIVKFYNDPVFVSIIDALKPKLLKYFEVIPPIYVIACILDPRAKTALTQQVLEYFHEKLCTGVDTEAYMKRISEMILQLYAVYFNKMNTVRGVAGQQPTQHGRSRNDDEGDDPIAALRSRHKRQARESSSSSISYHELDSYYATNFSEEIDSMNEFDILTWWKSKRYTYPVLSAMARDIFAVQVSTVCSERAFSTGGRILSQKRCSLAEDTMECLICCQDWDLATTRTQNLMELDRDNEVAVLADIGEDMEDATQQQQ